MNEFFNSDFCFLLLNVLQKMLQPLPARFACRPNILLFPPSITSRLLHRLAAPKVSLLQPLPARFAGRPNLILFPPSMTYRLLHRLAVVNQGFQILQTKSILLFFFSQSYFLRCSTGQSVAATIHREGGEMVHILEYIIAVRLGKIRFFL